MVCIRIRVVVIERRFHWTGYFISFRGISKPARSCHTDSLCNTALPDTVSVVLKQRSHRILRQWGFGGGEVSAEREIDDSGGMFNGSAHVLGAAFPVQNLRETRHLDGYHYRCSPG